MNKKLFLMRLFLAITPLVVFDVSVAMQKATPVYEATFLSARAKELAENIKASYANEQADYQMALKGVFMHAVMAALAWSGYRIWRDDDESAQNLASVFGFFAQKTYHCAQHAWQGRHTDRFMVRSMLKKCDDFQLIEQLLACPELAKLFDERVCEELRLWAAKKRAKWEQEIPLVEIEYGMRIGGFARMGKWPRKPNYVVMAVSALLLYNTLSNVFQAEERPQK